MTSRRHSLSILVLSPFFLLAVVTSSVSAAAPKEGDYNAQACGHGPAFVNAFSKELAAGSYSVTHMMLAKEDDIWHRVSGKCNGAWQLVRGELLETGSCEYADPSGDKFFGLYTRKNQDGTWKVLDGTGKYSGMEMSGIWKLMQGYLQTPGEVKSCIQISGHWKMK